MGCGCNNGTDGCPAGFVIVTIVIVSWVISPILRDNLQPTFVGVIIHLLSTMDIPVRMIDPHAPWEDYYIYLHNLASNLWDQCIGKYSSHMEHLGL